MDISCIISSGDLELYVLGLLPEEESKKMEQLILLFPELKEETDRISETLEALSMQSTQAPGPLVKEKILKKLSTLDKTSAVSVNTQARDLVFQNDSNGSPAKVVSLNQEKKNYWLAASFAGLMISLAAIIYLVSENRKKQNDIAALEQNIQTTNQHYTALQEQKLAYEQVLQLVQDENTSTITLDNVPGKPEAVAKIFWNKQSKEVFVLDVSLPRAPAGKQYQLWAIVDGKPVSAGLLAERKNRAQKMNAFEKADAFAITLENEGGSAQPTLEEMYVMGKSS